MLGFPEAWQNVTRNYYGHAPRLYQRVKGQVFWAGRMISGLEQGDVLSCLDMPLLMEMLVQHYFYRLRCAQLKAQGWLYADDVASVHAVPRVGALDNHAPPVLKGALDECSGGGPYLAEGAPVVAASQDLPAERGSPEDADMGGG